MKLSINVSELFCRYDYEKCVDIYKNAGFEAMDYDLEPLSNDKSIFNTDDYKAEAERIRKIALGAGMPITQTHAPFKFKLEQWRDPVVFKDVIFARTVRCLEISKLMGAKIVVVHPLHHRTYEGNEEEIFEWNMDFYKNLIPYCKEFDIKVAVENMFQVDLRRKYLTHDVCSHPEEFVRYIDTLDSEYMVACLDVGHIGLPCRQSVEAQDVIRVLGHDRLKSLHIHDNNYCSDQHIMPYMGKMNWAEITKALGEIDYDGDFTYEVRPTLITECDEGFVPVGAKIMADVGKYLVSMVEANRIKK